jgi:hypothetical protein
LKGLDRFHPKATQEGAGMIENICLKLFQLGLLLYPAGFRSQFAEEMAEVFSEVISDTLPGADRRLLKICLREFSLVPYEAFRLRWEAYHAGSKKRSLFRCRWEGPLTRKELALAMAVFIAPAMAVFANFIPSSILTITVPLVTVFLLIMLFAGLVKGFPRWSLPYLGLVFSAFSFLFLFNQTIDLFSTYLIIYKVQPNKWGESERLLLQIFSAGMMWLSLFVFIFLVIAASILLKRFRGFYCRLRWDWTQVSFILYCGSILGLILLFDKNSQEVPFLFASLLCLAVGAWLYLRSPEGWQRLFVLLAGITLAMIISTAGKWATAPNQVWYTYLLREPLQKAFWFEIELALLEWGWLVLILLIPGIMNLFPPPKELETT